MWTKVRKEDGRYVMFNLEKVAESISKASISVNKNGLNLDDLVDIVLELLPSEMKHKIPSTDDVGRAVEKALMHAGHDDIARAFILYRDNRHDMREANSSLMQAVEKITVEASKDNANTPPSFPSKVLQVSEAALAKYNLSRVLSKEISEAHRSGAIHMHDLFGYGLAPNCISVPLKRMLIEGFSTGTGNIRPPKRPSSILALAAIILQSNQNEMVGGQMYAHFDSDIAEIISTNCKYEPTEEEIYQAIEGFIYNLNTMASLPGYEKIWLYDCKNQKMLLKNINEFYDEFEKDRYLAPSLNRNTGEVEFKPVLDAYKHKNVHDVLKIHGQDGRKVFVTENHSLIGISSGYEQLFEEVTGAESKQILEIGSDFTIETGCETVSDDFARFLGYYVAEGWGNGSSIYLSLYNKSMEDDVVTIIPKLNNRWHVRTEGSITKRGTVSTNKNTVCNVDKYFVEHITSTCGKGAINKRIPESILFGTKTNIISFLDGYISGDGTVSKEGRVSMSTISYELACGLLLLFGKLGMKASLKTVPAGKRWNAFPNAKEIYSIKLTYKDSRQIKLTHFDKQQRLKSINDNIRGKCFRSRSKSFHYSMMSNIIFNTLRLSSNPFNYYNVSEDDISDAILELDKRIDEQELYKKLRHKLEHIVNVFPVNIKCKEIQPNEDFVYDISVEDNENFLTGEGIFVHNSRFGAQRIFSTIVIGSDTSKLGRIVTKYIFRVMQEGMDGSTFIWPNVVYRLKDGINLKEGDPNYDLTMLAYETAAFRMNPTFLFMDASFNVEYGNEVTYMGCRTRAIANVNGPEVIDGRGNVSFTTINLPRIAYEAKGNKDKALVILEKRLELVEEQLLHRFELTSNLRKEDFPFLFGQNIYIGSEKLKPEDRIFDSLKQGTQTFGFVGLEEFVKLITGKFMYESEESRLFGKLVIKQMRDYSDECTNKHHLNFSVLGTPAESASGRFCRLDKQLYGEMVGINDKGFYTNSSHMSVDGDITVFQKMDFEAPFHELCNGGHICHVFLDSAPVNNIKAIEDIILHAQQANVGYLAINFPINECKDCSNQDPVIEDICPKCDSKNIRKLRRITGYLAPLDTWGTGKLNELKKRVDR